jgi:uncharacterized protein DUF5063
VNDSLDSILQRFRAAATTFIEAVDSPSNLERSLFLAAIGRCLAELYTSALYLPSVSPDTLEIDQTPFPKEEWSKLFQSLKQRIEPLDSYWEILDSTEKGEPVQGSLAGDISEVYYDLKNDLRLEQKGISRADLLWELRESFRGHWGRHALEALKAIRDLHL